MPSQEVAKPIKPQRKDKMKFIHFEYPITKPFSRKWCCFLLAFGPISVGAFAAINFLLVGYDVVTITTTHFNSTRAWPWRLPWDMGSDSRSACEPHQFQLGDTFRTNISAFSYSIFDVQPSDVEAEVSDIQGGFFYANNALSPCDVVGYEILVKPGDRMITSTASIRCPPPLHFQAVTSWRQKTAGAAITDAMTSVSGEAYEDIYHGRYVTTGAQGLDQKIYKVIANGWPKCDSNPRPSSIAADEGNLYNIITIFYAAVRLDLGHWTPDNVFTNTTSFNNSMLPPDFSADDSAAFRSLANSKGMAYVNLTTPPPASERTAPAVIQIPYTCNVRKQKPLGSLVVSVISATLSMFLGAWGAIIAVLSGIARKTPHVAGPRPIITVRTPNL
ncbi:hypothetical protein B0H13DRAFT_2304153 [Mycena leptocephala]|nr:hypothetical protein B0H13DRAFT_2304153 [Mycena leptocephala]